MTTEMIPLGTSKISREQHLEQIHELEASLTTPLKKVLASVRKWIERGIESNMRRSWALGKQLKKVHDKEHYYGAGAIANMATVLNRHRSVLDKAMRFYLYYPEKKLEKLLEARTKNTGEALTYSHVELLTTVKLAEHRDKLQQQCLEHDWTPEELTYHIQVFHRQLTGTTRTPHAGGRPPKVPGTILQLANNLEKTTGVIVRNNDIMYNNDDVNFVKYVNDLPGDRVTPELLGKLDVCLSNIDKAIDVLFKIKPNLMEARANAERKMNAQAAAQGVSDAEIIDVKVIDAKHVNGRKPRLLAHKATA